MRAKAKIHKYVCQMHSQSSHTDLSPKVSVGIFSVSRLVGLLKTLTTNNIKKEYIKKVTLTKRNIKSTFIIAKRSKNANLLHSYCTIDFKVQMN